MDFKYIEQLIERYFAAETSLAEEHILRSFFQQPEVPRHLRRYQPLFAAEGLLAGAHLTDEFDQRLLQMTGQEHVRAIRISLRQRLQPLLRVAALVALVAGATLAMQHSSATAPALPGTTEAPAEVAAVEDELDPAATTPLELRADALVLTPDSAPPVAATPHRTN